MWSVSVPPGHSVLLDFHHLDVENASDCRYDRLSVSAASLRPVGEAHTQETTGDG